VPAAAEPPLKKDKKEKKAKKDKKSKKDKKGGGDVDVDPKDETSYWNAMRAKLGLKPLKS
jgi:hypothetical protein